MAVADFACVDAHTLASCFAASGLSSDAAVDASQFAAYARSTMVFTGAVAGALADVAADLLRTHDFVVPRWLAPLAGGAACAAHGATTRATSSRCRVVGPAPCRDARRRARRGRCATT